MLREMRLLQHFKHENVLCLKDIMLPPNGDVRQPNLFRFPESSRVAGACFGVVSHGRTPCSACKSAAEDFWILAPPLRTASPLCIRDIRICALTCHERLARTSAFSLRAQVKQWKDVYLVTELMDTDLHYIIHSKQALSDDHVQYFVYQILRGLKAVHSAKVLHRDLKPGNLLVNKNCDLKICDFGLARGVDLSQGGGRNLTEYVVTRWYRAPELLVENESYDEAIDIWSAGCILAEFLGRKALFPGRDYLQQLRLIIETLGTPSDADLSIISNRQAVEYIKAMPKREAVPFEDIFPDASADAIDLLSQMLVFDPRKYAARGQETKTGDQKGRREGDRVRAGRVGRGWLGVCVFSRDKTETTLSHRDAVAIRSPLIERGYTLPPGGSHPAHDSCTSHCNTRPSL